MQLFLKPKVGLIVRDPVSMQPLKEEGESKPENSYWIRRVMDGDVDLTPTLSLKGEGEEPIG